MTALIVYFLLAVSVSFLCSLLEAILLSVTHAHVLVLIENDQKSGRIWQKFKGKIDYPLSAILTVNTVANTVGAAGVGAQAHIVFGSGMVAVVSGLLTFCILIFAEIIPKTVGAVYYKKLAPVAAYPIQGLIWLTFPVVIAIEALGRIFGGKNQPIKITREEVAVAAEMGLNEGELLDRERKVIRNLLHLNHVLAKDVMTPRSVLFALHKDLTVREAHDKFSPIRFSRIPIYGENLDDITGLVHRYQINQALAVGMSNTILENISIPIQIIPESKSVADVLEELITKREHIFLVVDEYGGTAGIITLEDAIETLLGVEIVDELDSVEDMRSFAREQWEKNEKN